MSDLTASKEMRRNSSISSNRTSSYDPFSHLIIHSVSTFARLMAFSRSWSSYKFIYLSMYKKIAPICYLTPFGFIVAAVLFASSDEKRSVDLLHLRQSFGLYVTGLFFILLYKVLGTDLFYADLSSLIVLIPLLILWFLGFKAAMQDKETPLPLVGQFYQKCFGFFGR